MEPRPPPLLLRRLPVPLWSDSAALNVGSDNANTNSRVAPCKSTYMYTVLGGRLAKLPHCNTWVLLLVPFTTMFSTSAHKLSMASNELPRVLLLRCLLSLGGGGPLGGPLGPLERVERLERVGETDSWFAKRSFSRLLEFFSKACPPCFVNINFLVFFLVFNGTKAQPTYSSSSFFFLFFLAPVAPVVHNCKAKRSPKCKVSRLLPSLSTWAPNTLPLI